MSAREISLIVSLSFAASLFLIVMINALAEVYQFSSKIEDGMYLLIVFFNMMMLLWVYKNNEAKNKSANEEEKKGQSG